MLSYNACNIPTIRNKNINILKKIALVFVPLSEFPLQLKLWTLWKLKIKEKKIRKCVINFLYETLEYRQKMLFVHIHKKKKKNFNNLHQR